MKIAKGITQIYVNNVCFWSKSKNTTTAKQKSKHTIPCQSQVLNWGPLAQQAGS